MHGNSFANGPADHPRQWEAGWQAPEPVSIYTLAEDDRYS